jgi:hypothetical protein
LHLFGTILLSEARDPAKGAEGSLIENVNGQSNQPLFGTENSSSDGGSPALFFAQAAFPRPAEKQSI